jgi:ATP-binding protein involved in chromosome partitioning
MVDEQKHDNKAQGASQELPKGAHPSFMNVIRQKERIKQRLSNIKHKIGVYSAKGGVGKTTTAVNIAFALKRKGFSVGLLDADIDCPNVTMFLGMEDSKMEPVMPLQPLMKDGIKVASTAMLVDEVKHPIIWRGPLVAKMISDFLENTDWGELDYLIVDLPPGTSDSPLSIMQLLGLDGFVIVTTPQRIACVNSIRSGMMAKRLGVSVLGIVENMSAGKAGKNTEEVAKTLDTELLGVIPMQERLADLADEGKVPVLAEDGIYSTYLKIVDRLTK